jgi:hypothetical protein
VGVKSPAVSASDDGGGPSASDGLGSAESDGVEGRDAFNVMFESRSELRLTRVQFRSCRCQSCVYVWQDALVSV